MITISKYANRKLYDSTTKRHITLDEVLRYVRTSTAFKVHCTTWGNDITHETILKAIHQKELDQVPDITELQGRARKLNVDEIL